MEIAKLVLQYINALAWPALAIFLALYFRRELRAILNRVSRAKLPGGLDIDFETEHLAPEEARERVIKGQVHSPDTPSIPQGTSIPDGEVPVDSTLGIQHAYLIEKLALDKVEQNLNRPIQKFIRVKKGNRSIDLDGLIFDKNYPIDDIVEVKWLRDPRRARDLIDLLKPLENILTDYEEITGKKARLVYVLVVPQSVKEVRDYLLPLIEAYANLECKILVLDYDSIGFKSKD